MINHQRVTRVQLFQMVKMTLSDLNWWNQLAPNEMSVAEPAVVSGFQLLQVISLCIVKVCCV